MINCFLEKQLRHKKELRMDVGVDAVGVNRPVAILLPLTTLLAHTQHANLQVGFADAVLRLVQESIKLLE